MAVLKSRGEAFEGGGGDWYLDTNLWEGLGDKNAEQREKKAKREKVESVERKGVNAHRRSSMCTSFTDNYLYRRAFSETRILDMFGMAPPKVGTSYHVVTGGDIDQIAWLRYMLRHENIRTLLLATWVISAEDVLQIEKWLDEKKIDELIAFTGDIFPKQYVIEWGMMMKVQNKFGGRVQLYSVKNHAKIIAARGDKFPFAVESSANCNTNPRYEHACITIDGELVEFYIGFFKDIIKGEVEDGR